MLFADRLPAMRDAAHYYYPLFKWCAGEWGAGRIPLWNSQENCGSAVFADPTASLWYPGKLVFALPVDFSVRYKLYVFGHAALGAAAAFWLARHWGASAYGAALAGLAYACGGSVLFAHCNVVYLVGAAWLPAALLLVDAALRDGRWRAAMGLGIVLALMVLGGDPQMAYHVLLLGALYALILTSGRRQPSDGAAPRVGVRFALLAVSALVAFLLAAIQIVPSSQATTASERARADRPRSFYEAAGRAFDGQFDWSQTCAGLLGQPPPGTHQAAAYDFSVAPWRMSELVWPNVGGRMFPKHRRWFSLLPAESRIWSPSLYLGLLPLVLGVGAFRLRSADSRVRWLSWTVLLFTLASFGTFGLGWLARQTCLALGGGPAAFPVGDGVGGVYWLFVVLLPKYVLFRYPAKLLVVASLGISVLAALGWDRAMASRPTILLRSLQALGALSAIAALAAVVASRLIVLGPDAADPAFGPFDSGGAWIDITTSLAHAAVAAFAASWLLARASWGLEPAERSPARPRLWQPALLALCAVELVLANSWLVPTVPADVLRQPSAIARAIDPGPPPPRVYRARRWLPPEFAAGRSANRLEEIVAWERATLAGRYALLDDIHLVNSQTGLEPAEYGALLDAVQPHANAAPNAAALERLGVAYLILPGEMPSEFADPVLVDSLPSGTGLRRMAAPAPVTSLAPVTHQPDLRALYWGAATSTVAWIILALAAIVSMTPRRLRAPKP